MELFLPSLFVIVIAALLAFVIIPRMGSLILAVVSLVALLAAGVHHYNFFYSEYQLSTWQNGIGANAPFFILGLAFLFIVGAIYFMFTGSSIADTIQNIAPIESLQNSVEKSITNMPPANTATNPFTGMLNNGLQKIVGNNKPANNKPFNNKPVNNKPLNNKSQIIPGLNYRASEI